MNNNDKIIVHRVDLGFNIDEAIASEINAKISETAINEAKSIIDEVNNSPSVKKLEQQNEVESKLDAVVAYINEHKSIKKELMLSMTGLNIISVVGKLRNFVNKRYKKQLIKLGKDDYGLTDLSSTEQPI